MTPGAARAAILLLHLALLWPSARWYVLRMTDGAGEPWGLACAALAVWAAWIAAGKRAAAPDLRVTAALLVTYAVALVWAPPLVAAAAGVVSLCALHAAFGGARLPSFPLTGLAILALPDVSTLQFFIGWPMRNAVAAGAAAILRFSGHSVRAEGVQLTYGTRAVHVDGPCSGVWMLWGGLALTLALAAASRFGAVRTLVVCATVLPVVLAANVLRTTSAFLLETSPTPLPGWMHEGVGVVMLAAVAAGILAVVRRASRGVGDAGAGGAPCAA